MLSRTDESELLEPLHAGVHEAPLWGTFLARLRQRSRADAAVLVSQGMVLASGMDADQLREDADLPDFGAPTYATLRPGRVYAGDELVDPMRVAARRRPPAFARVLRSTGAETQGWLVTLRAARDFTAGDAAVLAGLAAHLAIALDTRARLAFAQAAAALSDRALSAARTGWLAFDRDARVLAASPTSAPLFIAAGVIAAPGRRLAGLSAEAEAGLLAACLGADTDAPRPLRLSGRGALTLLMVPIVNPQGAAVLLGLVRLPSVTGTGQHHLLMALHGLTETEARLADAIVGGASLEEAAQACGLTRESGRTYSKRVFAKTGTRGQPDLVRVLLTGLAGLDTSAPPA